MSPPVRKALRRPAVLEATGWSTSTLYQKIKEKKFPKGTRLDPSGRAVVWFDDQVAEIQATAREAAGESVAQENFRDFRDMPID